jgi:hypothetical protein
MSSGKRMFAALAAFAVSAVAVALFVAPAGATRVVRIHSRLTINVYGNGGKVKGNANCTEERTVVVKQRGHGRIGATKSGKGGHWHVAPEDLKFKGRLPFRVYAEVKPLSEGTAGTIYRCLAATSRTITIAGG